MSEWARAASRTVEIFTATSSGCESMARSIGLPVACLRVAADAEAAVAAMNAADYGGWTMWPGGFQPFEPQDGWRDWRVLPLGAGSQIPKGVSYAKGRFGLELPPHVTSARLEAALRGEFGRFAVTEVTTMPRWLVAQSDAGRPVLVMPRYTLSDANDFRAGAERLDNLYVMDPSFHVALIARAISRAIRRADEALRDV